MELLWIFVGIVYVVFRLIKDGDLSFSLKNLGSYVLTIIPVVIGGLVLTISEKNNFVVGAIIAAIIWISWFVGLIVWSFTKPKNADRQVKPKYTIQDLRQEFQKYGYIGISDSVYENLLHNINSPLNSAQSSTVAIKYCYNWMCEQATWEIDKLSRESIEEQLGVPFDSIPLDQSLPAGNSYLKRTTLAKNYLLAKDGLRYTNHKKYLDESDEYYSIFNKFVDEYTSEHH